MGHLNSKLQACQKCEMAGWGAISQDPKDPMYPGGEWLKPNVQNWSNPKFFSISLWLQPLKLFAKQSADCMVLKISLEICLYSWS